MTRHEPNAEIEALHSSLIRKVIVGAYGVSKYDYFRIFKNTVHHLHVNPVSIFCAVDSRWRKFYGSLTIIINQGLMEQLMKIYDEQQNELRRAPTSSWSIRHVNLIPKIVIGT